MKDVAADIADGEARRIAEEKQSEVAGELKRQARKTAFCAELAIAALNHSGLKSELDFRKPDLTSPETVHASLDSNESRLTSSLEVKLDAIFADERKITADGLSYVRSVYLG